MTKQTKKVKNKKVQRIEITLERLLDANDRLSYTILPIPVYDDELGPFMLMPTVRELLEDADMVFPDEALTACMEVGKLYKYGISNLAEDFHAACYIVKLGIDDSKVLDPFNDLDDSLCLVIPCDKLIEWAKSEPGDDDYEV